MENKVIIAIDDLHPEKGWGCEGDESVGYLEKLNKEFGCKFTLFVPSDYHIRYPLRLFKDWVEFWKNKDWVELAAHGHYHMCEGDSFGECEFYEIDTQVKAEERMEQCLSEWSEVDYKPKGWKNPGWLAHPESVKVIDKYFDYVALHEQHNHNIQWKSKMFFGCDGINETDINMYDDTIMFQSHIAGDWNDNVWNLDNFEQFRVSLAYLCENKNVKFKTMSEL